MPVFAVADLLLSFFPEARHWWEYLGRVRDADEAAQRTSLKALTLRTRKEAEEPGRR